MRRCSLATLGLIAVVVGCGGEDGSPGSAEEGADRPATDRLAAPEPRLEPVRCPAGAENCRSASGVILYVEPVDSDGDGDAHFVLSSREAITAPGISVIDVARELRPDPLPGPGDSLAAAGPVYPGSYGQRQIEAVRVRWAPAAS